MVGAVNRPGGFPLKTGQERMTVIQALALAEDLKPTARAKARHDYSQKPPPPVLNANRSP